MPWEHCGQPLNDDQPCPACGVTKASWTVEFQATRTFKVTRKAGGAALRFAVLAGEGAAERAVPGVNWRLVREGAPELAGETDELGTSRVDAGPGAHALDLPDLQRDDLLAVAPEAPVEEAPGGGVRLRVSAGPRYTLRVRPRLELKLVSRGRPLAGRRYRLRVGDDEDTGTLDDRGVLRAVVRAGTTPEVWVDDGAGGELHLRLRVAALAPVSDAAGVRQRLENLGLHCGREEAPGPRTAKAIRRLQARGGLPVTGELDDATRAKLVELHGS